MPRTVTLTERFPRVVRVRRADVDFLLTRHRGHVEVVPAIERGRYRLTALGVVGAIVAPTVRLWVRPKLPAVNLFHLLDPAAPPPDMPDRAGPAADLLPFLAGRFADRLADRAAAGMHRGYAERAEAEPFLRGRIDVPQQVREPRRDRLHSRFDEFTPDLPCNRLPRAVAQALLPRDDLGEATRARLRPALAAFADVADVPLTPDLLAADCRIVGYGPLLDLCRLIAAGLAPGPVAGDAPAPGFLLDLERAFERYVTAGLERGLAGDGCYRVAAQESFTVNQPAAGLPDLVLRPDVTLTRGGQPVAVLDVKWKRLGDVPSSDDLHQVLAYAAALGAPRAVLVYPGLRSAVRAYRLARAELAVEVRSLRVVGTAAKCDAALAHLTRSLRK
jgi:5-methylcytosine-specific restriction enzyme subunit McrC